MPVTKKRVSRFSQLKRLFQDVMSNLAYAAA